MTTSTRMAVKSLIRTVDGKNRIKAVTLILLSINRFYYIKNGVNTTGNPTWLRSGIKTKICRGVRPMPSWPNGLRRWSKKRIPRVRAREAPSRQK